jgi:hypothetical protein
MWWTSTATPGQSLKEFWTSLGDAFVEDFDAGKNVRFVGTRSVDVGGRRRPLQQWQPPTGAWSVLFRVDIPDAWLTAIATGVSADEVERWLHDVEPLRPGTATFRALRALS